MEVSEVIMILMGVSIVALMGAIIYCLCKLKQFEMIIESIPDPEKIIEEKMKTKIPIIIDENGKPMIPGMGPPPMKKSSMPPPDYLG